MGYLKTLLSKDVVITPFKVHKYFTSSLAVIPGFSSTGPSMFNGTNEDYPLGGGEEGTGSEALVYNSIKQLYYSNYLSGSDGNTSPVAEPVRNPDGTISGPSYTPNYKNNIQSIDEIRTFPTNSGEQITVLSIPSKQYGEYIKPGSYKDQTFHDDGQGNLIQTSNSNKVGNVIYEAGLILYTDPGTVIFPSPNWESTITIYETQYKCTIRASEYNYSMNPSLLTTYGTNGLLNSGNATYSDFVTGSDFSPYVTTVGLYDDDQNLLAVAKLAQPLPTSQTTDTTILINIDR